MAGITVVVVKNRLPDIERLLPREVNRIVREQVFVTEGDIKDNIVAYNYIDTGATLNSTQGRMTGETSGEVVVGTEYAAYGNYGTRYQPARPFASDAATKAEGEFPARFRQLEGM